MDTSESGVEAEGDGHNYSTDAVDLSLIRWFLSLTPAERLAFVERRTSEIWRIRELNAGE